MQQAQNNPKPAQRPKNQKNKADSFLEAFRDIGSGTASSLKNDLIKDGAKDIFSSLSPFGSQPNAGQSENFPKENPFQPDNFWENKLRQQKRQLEMTKREERVVFTRQERETQNQVKSLQGEIQKLASATGELSKEVQIAAMQEQANPGTYHLNFLQKLFAFVRSLRSQVQESSKWLSSCTNKSKKKNGYWNKFKKSGSSFSLHHDRAVATQAG